MKASQCSLFYDFYKMDLQEGILANCLFERSHLTVLKPKYFQYLSGTIS